MSFLRCQSVCVAMLLACAGSSSTQLAPRLPGEFVGGAQTNQPSTEVANVDPWASARLIEPPAPGVPTPLSLPPTEEFTLANGLRVWLVRDPAAPRVAMTLTLPRGRQHEQTGVAELTANLLVKGARGKSASAIAREVTEAGSSLSADAVLDATLVSCRALTENAGRCSRWLFDMMTAPTFAAADVAAARAALIAEITAEQSSPAVLAQRHSDALLFQAGLWHRGHMIRVADVRNVGRGDVVAWHRQLAVPSGAILTVAGDIDRKTLRGVLANTLGSWRAKGKTVALGHGTAVAPASPTVRIVGVLGAKDVQVMMATLGVGGTDLRYPDLTVWTHILGKRGDQSVMHRAFAAIGLPVRLLDAGLEPTALPGALRLAAAVRTADTVPAMKALQATFASFRKQGPSPDDVRRAIAQMTGQYAMRLATAEGVANAISAMHRLGATGNLARAVADYPVRVAGVTAASAQAVAQDALGDTAVTVLVGDVKQLAALLSEAGIAYEVVDGVSAPAPSAGPVDPAALAAATKLLNDALAKKGGEAALRGLHTITMAAKGTVAQGTQRMDVAISRRVVLPDRQRVDIDLIGQAKIEMALAGASGWQKTPDGVAALPAAEVADLAADRWREPELLLLRHKEAGTRVVPLPDERINNVPHGVVRLEAAQGSITLYINKKTLLVTRAAYPTGDGTLTVDEMSDYQAVDGILVAHRRKGTVGDRVTDYHVTEARFNQPIDEAIFRMPTP